VKLPSELLSASSAPPDKKLLQFLHRVCVPKVMAKSYHLKGTEALEAERIKLCQYLSEHDPANKTTYFQEISDITQRSIIRKGIRQIDESKIYVDELGIRSTGEKILKERFQRFMEYSNLSVETVRIPDTSKVLLVQKDERGTITSKEMRLSEVSTPDVQLCKGRLKSAAGGAE